MEGAEGPFLPKACNCEGDDYLCVADFLVTGALLKKARQPNG